MRKSDAVNVVRAYAAQFDIRCGDPRAVTTHRTLDSLFLRVDSYTLSFDTEAGPVQASVSRRTRGVHYFELKPTDPKQFLLPLWGVFPHYTSVTTFWRQGYGEHYKYLWHTWYRGLSDEDRRRYKQRFPAPTDERRCWEGFYEQVADVPATGQNPIGELIIGRV